MSEFTIRSESVDVEQIMKQIRQRILEKRGQDYTEDQIRELASVRLEKFLDPKNLRSDLLDQLRKSRQAVEPADIQPPKIQPPYTFDDQTLFASHRGFMRLARKLLAPLLKMMFNPNTLNQVLHTQAQFNVDILKREARRSVEQRQLERSRGEWNALYYEVLHNIVLETTRMGIEVQNLRMKVESLSSRLDFSERRVRALEGVVQYRPEVVRGHDRDDDRERRSHGSHGSHGSQGAHGAQGAQGAQAAEGAQGAAGVGGFVDGGRAHRVHRPQRVRRALLVSKDSYPVAGRSRDRATVPPAAAGAAVADDEGDRVHWVNRVHRVRRVRKAHRLCKVLKVRSMRVDLTTPTTVKRAAKNLKQWTPAPRHRTHWIR